MPTNDILIERQVEEALHNAGLLHNTDIKTEVRNGEVTLSGIVDVLAEKWAAGAVVQNVPGVVAVDNSLTVAIDRLPDDKAIAEAIREKLAACPHERLRGLTVTVRGGVASLEGEIDTAAEEQAAREIAAGVQGVKDVISRLHADNR